MNVYKYDELTGEYTGTETAHLDPLESKLKGKDVYLLPANATYTPPLAEKDGYVRVYTNNTWNYVEDNRGKEYWLDTDEYGATPRVMKELGALPENAVFVAPEKPQYMKVQERIAELKAKLSETDYIVIKIAEGEATQEEYAEVLTSRKAWRAEINELEE